MLEGELHVGGVDVSSLTRPGRGPQRIGSRQHRCPERVRRAATPLAERTRAMEGSTRQPSDLESTAGRRAWDPDGFDGPPHSCPVSRWRWRAVAPSAGQSPAGRRWRRERKGSVEHRLRAGVALSDAPVVLGTVEVADAETPGGGGPAPESVVSSGRLAVWLDVHAESSGVFTTGSRVAVEMARGEGGPALVQAEAPLQERADAPRRSAAARLAVGETVPGAVWPACGWCTEATR